MADVSAGDFYLERDGGDWYIVASSAIGGGRIAEDFSTAADAKLAREFIAGGPLPRGWRINRVTGLFCDLYVPNKIRSFYASTIWMRELARVNPAKFQEIMSNAESVPSGHV